MGQCACGVGWCPQVNADSEISPVTVYMGATASTKAVQPTATTVVQGVVTLGKSLESAFHADDWTDDQAADLADRLEQLAAAARKVVEARQAGGAKPSAVEQSQTCLLYTSPSPRDATLSRMPSSA